MVASRLMTPFVTAQAFISINPSIEISMTTYPYHVSYQVKPSRFHHLLV